MIPTARRIVVIGGVAAGPSAASKAARTNPGADVVLFEQGEHVSYGVCEIPYAVSGEIAPEQLALFTPSSLRDQKRVDVRILHRVESIEQRSRRISVRDLQTGRVMFEPYDRLVIATGSSPRRLGLEGEDARNVFHVKTLEDATHIISYCAQEKPERAVIIGAGFVGLEMADALRRRGLDVTMLHNHATPLSMLHAETGRTVSEELARHGVHFAGPVTVEGFVRGTQQRVTHVLTSAGSHGADLVISAIGVVPNVGLARSAGIGTAAGIITDQRQQTTADNVFAAGDCCEVRNLVTNRRMVIPLATLASRAGWVAGENAAGGNAVFPGAVRAIAIRVFDLEVAHAGLSEAEAAAAGFHPVAESISAWSRVAAMPGSGRMTMRLMADRSSGRLLGAEAAGTDGVALRVNTLAAALCQHCTVDEVRQWDLAYAPPFAPLWDPILVAANALRKKVLR